MATNFPTAGETPFPTLSPLGDFTERPTASTESPTTESPTISTDAPTISTKVPTTKSPTPHPTLKPSTESPTQSPTLNPTTISPTPNPTLKPTTKSPTLNLTLKPTTKSPTISIKSPTLSTQSPSSHPTNYPSHSPTLSPITSSPSFSPTEHIVLSNNPTISQPHSSIIPTIFSTNSPTMTEYEYNDSSFPNPSNSNKGSFLGNDGKIVAICSVATLVALFSCIIFTVLSKRKKNYNRRSTKLYIEPQRGGDVNGQSTAKTSKPSDASTFAVPYIEQARPSFASFNSNANDANFVDFGSEQNFGAPPYARFVNPSNSSHGNVNYKTEFADVDEIIPIDNDDDQHEFYGSKDFGIKPSAPPGFGFNI